MLPSLPAMRCACRRCDVFAFDPTVDYYSNRSHVSGVRRRNITFYKWGLRSTEDTYPYQEAASLHGLYGAGQSYKQPS